MFRLLTPGGGGYETPDDTSNGNDKFLEPPHKRQQRIERGSVYEFTRAQESV